MADDPKTHWENVYATKQPSQVSWTQKVPKTSLEFIHGFHLNKDAAIIDIGGGDSRLVDYLLDEGFKNITVLDISEKALERTKKRLGNRSIQVKWIVTDITAFEPKETYDAWHDRATFHFLITNAQVEKYLSIAQHAVKGYLIIGTFSEKGPKKCSGLDIKQYSEEKLEKQLSNGFTKIECITEVHTTPFNTQQNFLFCSFKKKQHEIPV